jgi:hypothetical protein
MATKEVHSSGDNFSRCVRVAFAGRAVGGEGRLLAIWKRSVKGGVELTSRDTESRGYF